MSAEEKSKRPSVKYERVTLNRETALRLDGWVASLNDQVKGIRVSRADLIDWLVMSHPEVLSHTEIKEIREQYFDEITLATWVLKQLKDAKAKGEKLSLPELLGALKPATPKTRRITAEKVSEDGGIHV